MNDKYNIETYLSPQIRKQLLDQLNISRSAFYVKSSKKIGEKGGFEICEMYIIAKVLNRKVHQLLTDEALKFYSKKSA